MAEKDIPLVDVVRNAIAPDEFLLGVNDARTFLPGSTIKIFFMENETAPGQRYQPFTTAQVAGKKIGYP